MNFVGLNIDKVVDEGKRVNVCVRYTADNLDAEGVHMFVVEDNVQTEFYIFDDSQKLAAALSGSFCRVKWGFCFGENST